MFSIGTGLSTFRQNPSVIKRGGNTGVNAIEELAELDERWRQCVWPIHPATLIVFQLFSFDRFDAGGALRSRTISPERRRGQGYLGHPSRLKKIVAVEIPGACDPGDSGGFLLVKNVTA